MRATFMPASIRSPMLLSVAVAGPRVQTILARGRARPAAPTGRCEACGVMVGVRMGVDVLGVATAVCERGGRTGLATGEG